MLKGQEGQSIKEIKKTSTNGFVDTYTITLTDGTTSTFTVKNGEKGDTGPQGEKGEKGDIGPQGPQGDKGDTGSIDNLLDNVYPVGSIYMSVNSTEPSILFGGTWERLKGRFLIGAGAVADTNSNARFGSLGAEKPDFASGEKGGQYYHKLNIDEMPEHTHKRIMYNGKNMSPSGTHANPDDGYHFKWENGGSDSQNGFTTVGSNGGGQEHNNMPPYLAVYMWKRTA